MIFGNNYYNAMDREMEVIDLDKEKLSIKEIGVSAGYGKDALQDLKAAIFSGAGKVELGFTGRGKGWKEQGNITPESYGKEEREAIRDLARLNEVDMSTHASIAVGNVSGLTEGGFNDEARQQGIFEIQRAIDFAADTTKGGAVVVHLGEWQRPIMDFEKQGFTGFPEEKQKAVRYLVDRDSGKIQPVSRELKVWDPIKKGETIGPNGEKIPIYETNPDGTIKVVEKSFDQIVKENKHLYPGLTDEQVFIRYYFTTNKEESHAEALRWAKLAEEREKDLKKIREARKFYEELEAITPPEDRERLKRRFEEDRLGLLESEKQLPSEYLKEKERELETDKRWTTEASLAYMKRYHEADKSANDLVPIEQYAFDKTADSLARSAIYAFEQEKKNKLEKPLFIAPENIFPETYGGHPDELKKIILESRKKMADMLTPQYGAQEAKKIAEDHIKATFDIGHAYTWRKYFKGSDEEFKEWLVKKVDELNKEKVIGHVHVTDNFGYYDDHLKPGMGKAPIKEIVENLKSHGVRDIIVEQGAEKFETMLGGWKEFGSPIYGVGRWSEVEHGYFGKTKSPYFLFGDNAPSQEWMLYSQAPLE